MEPEFPCIDSVLAVFKAVLRTLHGDHLFTKINNKFYCIHRSLTNFLQKKILTRSTTIGFHKISVVLGTSTILSSELPK